jgi:hypothetical protein
MPKKRLLTYFNTVLPVWKHEKIGAGQCTIRFVIKGSIVSKKNNQMAVVVKKDPRAYLKKKAQGGIVTLQIAMEAIRMAKAKMIGNVEYESFLNEQRPVIEAQKLEWIERLMSKGFAGFPIPKASMSLRLYFKGTHITDTVNKQQTIQDLLVDCGVIADDNYENLNPIHSESACFKNEIIENIAFVSLSFRMDDKRKLRKKRE